MSNTTSRRLTPVCIVSSHPLATRYLASLLRRVSTWNVVELKERSLAREATQQSSVFVVDASSLPVPFTECIARLRVLEASARFVVIDNESVDAGRLVNLRVQGFLTYEDVPSDLLSAVRAVIAGKTWVRPEVVRSYLDKVLATHNGGLSSCASLTVRESEIMEFLKKRLSNAEIARHLGIRSSTVKFHVSNLFSKLDVSSRRELLNREGAVKLWNNLLLYSALPRS